MIENEREVKQQSIAVQIVTKNDKLFNTFPFKKSNFNTNKSPVLVLLSSLSFSLGGSSEHDCDLTSYNINIEIYTKVNFDLKVKFVDSDDKAKSQLRVQNITSLISHSRLF